MWLNVGQVGGDRYLTRTIWRSSGCPSHLTAFTDTYLSPLHFHPSNIVFIDLYKKLQATICNAPSVFLLYNLAFKMVHMYSHYYICWAFYNTIFYKSLISSCTSCCSAFSGQVVGQFRFRSRHSRAVLHVDHTFQECFQNVQSSDQV